MKAFVLTHQHRESILSTKIIHAETAEKAAESEGFSIVSMLEKIEPSDQTIYFLSGRGHEEWHLFEC